jgi:hypothetical protein
LDRILRHAVGKSTFKDGFVVPRDFEQWIGAPARGSKREIRLVFGRESIPATLRRIKNEKGSVQVRYGNKGGGAFRAWLTKVFAATLAGARDEFFEIRKTQEDTFLINPFPSIDESEPRLRVDQWVFHRGSDRLFQRDTPLAEIPAIVRGVPFIPNEGQVFYNQAFSRSFICWNWRSEVQVIPELGLKSDFAKEGVQAEIEFGNARSYYQDYIKFLLGNRYSGATLGVLVVPTSAFARHLCEIGRQRAVSKGRTQYSGMIDFDKVRRELTHLRFMLLMPIAIAGISNSVV